MEFLKLLSTFIRVVLSLPEFVNKWSEKSISNRLLPMRFSTVNG